MKCINHFPTITCFLFKFYLHSDGCALLCPHLPPTTNILERVLSFLEIQDEGHFRWIYPHRKNVPYVCLKYFSTNTVASLKDYKKLKGERKEFSRSKVLPSYEIQHIFK